MGNEVNTKVRLPATEGCERPASLDGDAGAGQSITTEAEASDAVIAAQPGQPAQQAQTPSKFDEILARAAGIVDGGIDEAREIIRAALEARLPQAEAALVHEAVAEQGKFSRAVMGGLKRDAANYLPDFGYVATEQELASAFVERLRAGKRTLIATEGAFWAYTPRFSHDIERAEEETAFFKQITTEEAQAEMLRAFPELPVAGKKANRDEALRRAVSAVRVADDFFALAEPGVNLRNGFLRLDTVTGEVVLEEHDQRHRARSLIDVQYDPAAEAPTFEEGLLRIVGNDQTKAIALLEFMASTLFGFTPSKDAVRTVMVLFGPPRSGKSTVIRLLQLLTPSYAQSSIPPGLWSDERHLIRLRNVVLNTVTELDPNGRAIAGDVFKKVASLEPVTARDVFRSSTTFTPRARHVFACNGLPTIGEKDSSVQRRLLVLRFASSLEDDELRPDFLDVCWKEAPGIINYIAAYASDLVKRGTFPSPRTTPNWCCECSSPPSLRRSSLGFGSSPPPAKDCGPPICSVRWTTTPQFWALRSTPAASAAGCNVCRWNCSGFTTPSAG